MFSSDFLLYINFFFLDMDQVKNKENISCFSLFGFQWQYIYSEEKLNSVHIEISFYTNLSKFSDQWIESID